MALLTHRFCAEVIFRGSVELKSESQRGLGDFYALCVSALGDPTLRLYVVCHLTAEFFVSITPFTLDHRIFSRKKTTATQ